MKKLFIGITTLAAVIAIGFAVSVYAWQPPTQSAPGGNVDAPLNTGPAMQIKTGALGSVDQGWGLFGIFGKFQHGSFGLGCPFVCPATNPANPDDLFTAGTASGLPNSLGYAPFGKGISVLNDGTFRLKDGTTTTPGQVLTATNANGDVAWQTVPAQTPFTLPNSSATGNVLTATNTTGGYSWQAPFSLPQGGVGNVLAYGTNGWGPFSSIDVRPTSVTIPQGVTFAYMAGMPNIHVGDVLTAVNTAGSMQWKPAPTELPATTDNYTLRYNGTLSKWEPSGTLQNYGNRIRIVDGTQAGGKFLASDQSGFASWQYPIPLPGPNSQGQVFTSMGQGSYAWANPTGTVAAGTINHTLRNNGSAWVDTGLLQNTGAQVAVVPTNTSTLVPFVVDLSNVPGSGAAARNGINIKVGPQVLNVGENATVQTNATGFTLWSTTKNSFQGYWADLKADNVALTGNLTGQNATLVNSVRANKGLFDYTNTGKLRVGCPNLGACDSNATDMAHIGTYIGAIFKKGLNVKSDGSITAQNTGITVDITQDTGPAGTDALTLNANPTAKSQYPDQVDIVSNTVSQFHFYTTAPGRNNFGDIRAGEGVFGNAIDQTALRAIGSVQIQGGNPDNGKVLASVDNQGNAEWGALQSDVTVTPGTTPSPTLNTIVVNQNCTGRVTWGNFSSSNPPTGKCDIDHTEQTRDLDPIFHLAWVKTGVLGRRTATAFCPSDHPVLTGGGGDCEKALDGAGGFISIPASGDTSPGRHPAGNGSQPAGWEVTCGTSQFPNVDSNAGGVIKQHGYADGDAHAYAICARYADPIITVNTHVQTSGGKQWHLATDLKATPVEAPTAPNPTVGTCNAAYSSPQYGSHTFQNTPDPQVGYIHQVWEGSFVPQGVTIANPAPIHKISGPGTDGPVGILTQEPLTMVILQQDLDVLHGQEVIQVIMEEMQPIFQLDQFGKVR
jgi:hypothetical protein